MTKTINILGAGISGLSCAIILAKNGYNVNVYESQNTVGTRFNDDWQAIENWSEDIDVLEEIRSFGINTDFYYEPLNTIDFHVGKINNKFIFKDTNTLAYLIQRGMKPNSLDNCLLKQAKKVGVNVFFNIDKNYIKGIKININATGPKKISGLVRGITFTTKSEDTFHMAHNNKIAKDFYAYLLIRKGHGTIATVLNKKCAKKCDEYLDRTLDYFSDFINMDDIKNGKRFSGFGHFEIKKNLKDDMGALLIGEAGGFQDYLWGFGMRYAIQTANYAAQSFITDENYETIIKKHLNKQMKKSLRNRRIYELFGKYAYLIMFILCKNTKHPLKILKKIYK
ncbi:MAG: NAD(P)/FAD-dependent oxidoreductase [DPANN group archaeon]|nr:NAD(P)/FAD-dependent oxidoreductase [DPANN group archaeon]